MTETIASLTISRPPPPFSPPPLVWQVSGHADAGTMIAVIGASGAGKSTLLDILARRFNKGRLEGQMLVNGKQISDDDFKEISGYVPQVRYWIGCICWTVLAIAMWSLRTHSLCILLDPRTPAGGSICGDPDCHGGPHVRC